MSANELESISALNMGLRFRDPGVYLPTAFLPEIPNYTIIAYSKIHKSV